MILTLPLAIFFLLVAQNERIYTTITIRYLVYYNDFGGIEVLY